MSAKPSPKFIKHFVPALQPVANKVANLANNASFPRKHQTSVSPAFLRIQASRSDQRRRTRPSIQMDSLALADSLADGGERQQGNTQQKDKQYETGKDRPRDAHLRFTRPGHQEGCAAAGAVSNVALQLGGQGRLRDSGHHSAGRSQATPTCATSCKLFWPDPVLGSNPAR
jgi:hypothetical protein